MSAPTDKRHAWLEGVRRNPEISDEERDLVERVCQQLAEWADPETGEVVLHDPDGITVLRLLGPFAGRQEPA